VGILLLLAADDAKDQAVKKAMKKLEGTWSVKLYEHDEKILSEDSVRGWKLVVTGDKYTMTIGNSTEEGIWKIDPSKKPAWVDVTPNDGPGKGLTRRGIYELKGDLGKVCFTEIGQEERPKEFGTKLGDDHYYWEFMREKP
jgi:uncharacterized protein (TIGR03067 family)